MTHGVKLTVHSNAHKAALIMEDNSVFKEIVMIKKIGILFSIAFSLSSLLTPIYASQEPIYGPCVSFTLKKNTADNTSVDVFYPRQITGILAHGKPLVTASSSTTSACLYATTYTARAGLSTTSITISSANSGKTLLCCSGTGCSATKFGTGLELVCTWQ
jgi:hypothetical protein